MNARATARSRRGLARLAVGLALWASGVAAIVAVEHRLWATGVGVVLIAIALLRAVQRGPGPAPPSRRAAGDGEAVAWRGLIDQLPTPMIRVGSDSAWALNRAARTVFGTDGVIVPVPPALRNGDRHWLEHEGRTWRLDRVVDAGGAALVALIDSEVERRRAEAHAEDEMVEVLGHELLNGLAPIVSLAESAVVAADRGDAGLAALLATLARRAEGLRRFVAAYRTLARLPAPIVAPAPLGELVDDLRILFSNQPSPPPLIVEDIPVEPVDLDRDQVTQALWALLRNAVEAGGADAPVHLHLTATKRCLTIDVTDAGAGVAMPKRSRIFRPFHTSKPDGSGIGLSLARRVARGHGGDLVLLDTAPTTFRMTFPHGRSG